MKAEKWQAEVERVQTYVRHWAQLMNKSQEWIENTVKEELRHISIEWYLKVHADSIGVFLKEEEGFSYDPQCCISSQELYQIYCDWCRRERVVPQGLRALSWRLKHSAKGYPVGETTLTRQGRRFRGFRGIRAVTDVADN